MPRPRAAASENLPAWTAQTETLLTVLTHRVAFLTQAQIARVFWTETAAGEVAVRRVLCRLRGAGYLESHRILAHPELPLPAPVFRWRPGEDVPPFGALAYQCQTRWTQPLEAHTAWAATALAARHFGGRAGRLTRPSQWTHDLHVGTLYCRLHLTDLHIARTWTPEVQLVGEPGERLPDAIVQEASGQNLALEFGGACKAARIVKLHTLCTRYKIGYELW